jgi:hypothetical protein
MSLFTAMVAAFTLMLVVVTYLNVWAYSQSERAQLFVHDLQFAHGEPTLDDGGLDLVVVIKNVGKHIATVTDLNVTPLIHLHSKPLADTPHYHPQPLVRTAPPIPPDEQVTVNARTAGFNATDETDPAAVLSESERVGGILSGQLPFDVYGAISYYNGFSVFGPSVVGYCFHYIPQKMRLPADGPFRICENPNYTYSR